MFCNKQLNGMQESIALNSNDIKKIYQMINKLNKNQDLFITALNEQRKKISDSIKVILYICQKTGIKLNKTEKKQNKTNKKTK